MKNHKMKPLLFFVCLLSLSTLTLSACYTSTPYRESTGQYIDSSAITMKVKSRLLADPDTKALSINVKTYKDIVELSGFVDNYLHKQRAVEIARHVEGVKGVKDALIVKQLLSH